MANVQYYGTGRRKHSVARVRLVAGEGNIKVNGRDLEEYFNYETLIRDVKQPLVITGNENKYDVIVTVEGGGYTGQAGAIRHGIQCMPRFFGCIIFSFGERKRLYRS